MLDLSVIIITKNEEKRLPACLKSLPHGVELILVDSGSTDATRSIAQAAGAKFVHREFDGYANQKNAALELVTRGWVLSLDADEELSNELRNDIEKMISGDAIKMMGVASFRLRRRLRFMGRTMRFGKTADAPVRLFRRGSGQFSGAIHERFVPTDTAANSNWKTCFAGVIIHTSYQDLTDYFSKLNRYTTSMAPARRGSIYGTGAVLRFCVRPIFEFLGRYILRLGFLDGYPGYCYALLSSVYSFTKYAKAYEMIEH